MAANRILYRSPALTVGQFCCPPENWRWRDINVNGDSPLAAFPSTSVVIQQAGRRPVLANPNHVMFYAPRERYRRVLHDARGDECIFVSLHGEAAEELLGQVGLHPHGGIPFGQGPSDPEAYLRLRLAACALVRGDSQPLAIEEAVHHAFTRSLERGIAVHQAPRSPRRKGTQRDHHRLAEEAKALLTERACSNDSLESLARVLHISAFHLARVFRERTGFSLHAYRTHLRLRLALERLSEARADLGGLARELGFSSHAHFTGVFNSVFGEPPSAVRTAFRV